MSRDPPEGCSAGPCDESNLFVWSASIVGPSDTAWEGGVYSLSIHFKDNYPTRPPRVRFTTKMFHPNISEGGAVCVDLLGDKWRPVYTVPTMLTALRSLLTDPNTASPNNSRAAELYTQDIKLYNKEVAKCAERSLG